MNVTLVQAEPLLKAGAAADASLIPAPSSTKNKEGVRDAKMPSSKKNNNYHFGMKAHIGVDADSGLVRTVHTTTGLAQDLTKAREHQPEWHVAMTPSKRKALDAGTPLGALLGKLEKLKASVRAKVEHPFQVIKCQWGYRKAR